MKTNASNRVFRQYISKNNSELCNDNKFPIQVIQHNKTSNHLLKTRHISFIINSLGNDWEQFLGVFNAVLEPNENSKYYGNKVITDISINKYLQL